jgi:hypothetical protein
MSFIVFLGAGIYEVLVVTRSGVVDEDVDAAKYIGGSLDGSNRRLLLAGVTADRDGLGSERFSLLFQRVEAFLTTGGEDKPGAFTGQCAGAGSSNTGARTGDERYFSLEFVGHIFFWLMVQIS